MQTILNIKTQKELKEEARDLADDLGVSLTTVVNSYLKQFIRERKLVLEMEPRVKDILMDKWFKISIEANKNKNISKKFEKADDVIKYLKL